MEDISRELERELARAKPRPFKTRKEKKILIVDDCGELRSGAHLKVMVNIFCGISIVGILCAAGYYYRFSNADRENTALKQRLAAVETKADRLTRDKEILMARLVMAGKKPEIERPKEPAPKAPPAVEKEEDAIAKPGASGPGVSGDGNGHGEVKDAEHSGAGPKAAESVVGQTAATASPGDARTATKSPEASERSPAVSVEKFSVGRGNRNGELVVRFNIRNVSKESKEVSGRIFAVLKTAAGSERDWVVVPGGSLEKGVPAPYGKGQYFSISRFKPVRFTVRSHASPKRFTQATIYVFNTQGELQFDNTIQINRADQGHGSGA